MQGQDIAVLIKLALSDEPRMQSKMLAQQLFVSPSEISKSLKRSVAAGLLYVVDSEKRVNRSGLLEFLIHGLKYAFPAEHGSLARGIPTAVAAEPLRSRFLDNKEPPPVWPHPSGKVRGIALFPLYEGAPKAALEDARLYGALSLCDAVRSGRVRERNLAADLLKQKLHG